MPRPKINHFAYSPVPHSAATKPFAASESLPEYKLEQLSLLLDAGELNRQGLPWNYVMAECARPHLEVTGEGVTKEVFKSQLLPWLLFIPDHHTNICSTRN